MANSQWQDHFMPGYSCETCGKEVEILNNDLIFSQELHNQSHKKLTDINRKIHEEATGKSEVKLKLNTSQNDRPPYICTLCNESFEMVNNDFELSLELHLQNRKHKENSYQLQNKETFKPKDLSSLDEIFNTFCHGLKCHQHFVKLHMYSTFCKICNLEIGNILNISNHLKTRLHEDNVLLKLKLNLPTALHDVMEFVTFFGSNLYCNLCSSQINLCSNNIHETIVNIIAHNYCGRHLKCKTINESKEDHDEGNSMLNDLAKYDNSINENKGYIDCKMVPNFKCKLCDTHIEYNENKEKILNNLTKHLHSLAHRKRFNATLAIGHFELIHISSNVKHNFRPTDDGVVCLPCNNLIGENIEQLISHMKKNSCYKKQNNQSISTEKHIGGSKPINHSMNNILKKHNMKSDTALQNLPVQSSESVQFKMLQELMPDQSCAFNIDKHSKMYTVSKDLEILLNTLPKELESFFIKNNELGLVICTVCECTLNMSISHIKEHLSGKGHRNNKDTKMVNSLFEFIPQHLQSNRMYIKVLAGDQKNFVLCIKCNALILPLHKWLLQHLQGASHNRLLDKPSSAQSVKDQSKLAELSQNTLLEKPTMGKSAKKNSKLAELSQNKLQNKPTLGHSTKEKSEFSQKDLLDKPTLGQSVKDKSRLAELLDLKLQQTGNRVEMNSNNELIGKLSPLSPMMNTASKLKYISGLSEKLETSCIMINEKGDITCRICNYVFNVSTLKSALNNIQLHLSSKGHKKNKEKMVVNSLFENIPQCLQVNKISIKVQEGDADNVFCSKCIVKIPTDCKLLVEHLQGATHTRMLGNTTSGQSIKDKSKSAELPENKLNQTETCVGTLSKNVLVENPSLSCPKVISVASELKAILDDLSAQFETSCIMMNEKGNVTCSICNCDFDISNYNLKIHLSGMRHKKNKDKKFVNSLFENIPQCLQVNKVYIKVQEGDADNVFCSKCNVKIPNDCNLLVEHLQGATHTRMLGNTTSGQSIKDKSKSAELPENKLNQAETCVGTLSKNVSVENPSLSCPKVISVASELKAILDDLSAQFETSCIMMNEKGDVTCRICNCDIGVSNYNLKIHLSGMRHKKNKDKNFVNSLFENIPQCLQINKVYIKVQEGDADNVFCSKCNVKIPTDCKLLVEHLQGATHTRMLGNTTSGQSIKDKSAELPENKLNQTETCVGTLLKNVSVENPSLSCPKVISVASELKAILDDLSAQFETSCIMMNEKGDVTCRMCNCDIGVSNYNLKIHLSGMRHKKNKDKKFVNSLFENIPQCLQVNKVYIKVQEGDADNVLCSKCNVKIPTYCNLLVEHLQGATHTRMLSKPTSNNP